MIVRPLVFHLSQSRDCVTIEYGSSKGFGESETQLKKNVNWLIEGIKSTTVKNSDMDMISKRKIYNTYIFEGKK